MFRALNANKEKAPLTSGALPLEWHTLVPPFLPLSEATLKSSSLHLFVVVSLNFTGMGAEEAGLCPFLGSKFFLNIWAEGAALI